MDMGIAVSIEFLGPLSVAVITGKSWRERVGIGIAAVGVVLLAGISLANPSGNGTFLYGLIAILIGGSMWGMYIITGRRVAAGGNSLDNLYRRDHRLAGPVPVPLACRLWLMWFTPRPMPRGRLSPGGSLKLLALLFVISLMASFIPYVVEQITLRRTTSGAFSVRNPSIPPWRWPWDWRSARFQTLGNRRCGVR